MYSPEIEAIHHAFRTAGDTLLAESQLLIDGVDPQKVDKVTRLQKLGFTSSSQVVDSQQELEKREKAVKQARIIQDYSLRYPNQKFITKAQVEQICEKYKLVCGPIKQYTGFVPEKNLKEIESFRLNRTDEPTFYQIDEVGTRRGANMKKLVAYLNKINHLIEHDELGIGSYDLTKYGSGSYGSHYVLERLLKDRINTELGDHDLVQTVRYSSVNAQFQICAPSKDFKQENTKKTGFFLSLIQPKAVIQEILDPVVLQPVKGGYLVLTAWGPEASDPIVVNQKFN
ncbi:hypothetical protein CLV58_11915 [Spirosoma oryzae]|uniref:Uncharacterized protein n=1 Tax=Spirosoma oryzae TaxID=1469603 RepID=A0A2T0SKC9_9BACT|nr:hypothetical protein [Spirosoma oryzae]PRY33866.1 hypothetical protein CLV58_11915 [Spirosoma oryzae]